MARKPKPRVSYRHDAQYLLRLAHAVEGDGSRPPEWRADVIGRLTSLAYLFLENPSGQTQEGQKARTEAQEIVLPEERDPGED